MTHNAAATTQGPTRYSIAAERTVAVREFVHHAEVVLLHRIGIFHLFSSPRHIGDRGRLLSTPPRFFADKTLCRRVGREWRGLAAAGGAVAHGRAVPKRGILQPR